MAVARVEIPEIVINTSGIPVSGASVQVNIHGGGAATVYSSEAGAGTLANPLTTDSAGRIEGWLVEGSYDLVVSGTGLTTYTAYLEANKGSNSLAALMTGAGDVVGSSAANTPVRIAGGTGVLRAGTPPAFGSVQLGDLAFSPSQVELDYKAITADVAGINATTEAGAATVITGNSVAYDATTKMIQVCLPAAAVTAGGTARITLVLLRGATKIGQFYWQVGPTASFSGAEYQLRDTPGAATFAYALKAFVDSGTVTINAGAGGSGALVPAFVRVLAA